MKIAEVGTLKHKYKKSGRLFPYLLVIPGILLLMLIIFMPFIQNVYYSFTDYSLLNADKSFIGLQNYKELLHDKTFFEALMKSFIWVVLNLILLLVVGLTAAFIQNSKRLKGLIIFQALLLLPWILPEVVTGYTWKLLLSYQTGPYYKLLEFLHIITPGADIFSSDFGAMMATVMANVWRSFPIVGITVYAKLQTLSAEQIEAAVIDGANRFVVFRDIELPHITTALISVATLCFVWTFNAFGIIHVMTGGGPAGVTETLPVLLQKQAFQFYDYSMASSFAVMMILILLLIVVFINLLLSGARKKISS